MPHAVTVPGAIDAWITLLADHGTMALDRLLQPAIGYAENGWPVTQRVAVDWSRGLAKLNLQAPSREQYTRDGTAPKAGEIWALPKLARTLRRIAEAGRAGFYEGEVAEDLVRYLNSLGGKHTMEDFAELRGEYVTPIATGYKGYDIHQIPPNGQGITALIMLNILAERVLGMPQDVRLDKGIPFSKVPTGS